MHSSRNAVALLPVESLPAVLTDPPKHPTAGVPSASHGKLSASLRLPTTTELEGTPVTLAMQLAKVNDGVLSAVPPQMETFAFSTWHRAGVGAGAGAAGKGGVGGGTVRVVGEGRGTGEDETTDGAVGAGAGA